MARGKKTTPAEAETASAPVTEPGPAGGAPSAPAGEQETMTPAEAETAPPKVDASAPAEGPQTDPQPASAPERPARRPELVTYRLKRKAILNGGLQDAGYVFTRRPYADLPPHIEVWDGSDDEPEEDEAQGVPAWADAPTAQDMGGGTPIAAHEVTPDLMRKVME